MGSFIDSLGDAMRVAVTGATGFVGSHLVAALNRAGHSVTCLVRKSSSLKWLAGLDYELAPVDLDAVSSMVPVLPGHDAIIHCAGLVRATNYDDFLQVNAIGTRHLAQAAVEAVPELKQFIQVSSMAAFGPSVDGQPVDEQSKPNPIDAYGKSKLAGERELEPFSDRLPITVIRPSAVYGPRDQDIYQVFRAARYHLRPVVGIGTRRLSLCHVSDIVQVIVLALGNKQAIGQAYVASTDQSATWLETTAAIAQGVGTWAVVVPVPPPVLRLAAGVSEWWARRSGRPRSFDREKAAVMLQGGWTCDVSKAKRELGYSPKVTLADGARTTAHWYRENGWL